METASRITSEPCDPNTPFYNGWLDLCTGHKPWYVDYAQRQHPGGYSSANTSCCAWADQGAMMIALQKYGDAGRRHVRYDAFRDYSSQFPWYGEGDLVVHMLGSTFFLHAGDTFTRLL